MNPVNPVNPAAAAHRTHGRPPRDGTAARRADALLAALALTGVAAVAFAWWTQHRLGMLPCAWCVLQRVIYLALSASAAAGLLSRRPAGRRAGAALALLLAASGLAAATWQHFVAVPAGTCDLSLAERIVAALGLDARWPDLFMALTSCAEGAVRLLGVPYEVWSGALFVLLGGAALAVLRRPG